MLNFEDFFEISNKLLYLGAIDVNPSIPLTRREKILAKLKFYYVRFIVVNLILMNVSLIKFIMENYENLKMVRSALSNFVLGLMVTIKTFHFVWNRKRIKKVKDNLEKLFELSYNSYSDRYQRTLKLINISQKVYIFLVFGTEMMFFSIPIIQNIVQLVNGSDHWDRILYHQSYIPFSYEPLTVYISVYLWVKYIGFLLDVYLVVNEIFFDTLLVLLSAEFNNLAHELENFDFTDCQQDQEFKKLINKHCELFEISGEIDSIFKFSLMVTFLGSTIFLTFSMFQLFLSDDLLHSLLENDVFDLIKFSSYFNASLLGIFLFSFFCQVLTTSSERVAFKIMQSNWSECSDDTMKKNIQMVLLRAQKPLELTALGFFGINMEVFTYVSIFDGAEFIISNLSWGRYLGYTLHRILWGIP